jgi:hypothetical protein
MDAWPWMKLDAPAGQMRAGHDKATALPRTQGGTTIAFSKEGFDKKKTQWASGAKYKFLGCLGWVGNTYSIAGLEVSEKQVEKLGRALFSTAKWTTDFDTFWDSNMPEFPRAWPEKSTIPIVLTSVTAPPAKGDWQHLCFDELILAFWKIFDFTVQRRNALQAEVAKGGASCHAQEMLVYFEGQIAAAEKLARNVVFSMSWAKDAATARDMALQSREDLDTLGDFCGLFGWAKIKVIGLRYQEISAIKSRPATAAEVAEAFGTVKFGAGREVNIPTAGKMITIWKKLKGCKEASEIIMTSLAEWGRTSFFEDWTKLDVLLSKCSTPTVVPHEKGEAPDVQLFEG